jgi:hypothetical protein
MKEALWAYGGYLEVAVAPMVRQVERFTRREHHVESEDNSRTALQLPRASEHEQFGRG